MSVWRLRPQDNINRNNFITLHNFALIKSKKKKKKKKKPRSTPLYDGCRSKGKEKVDRDKEKTTVAAMRR